MDSFHDEIDEYMWLCNRMKSKQAERRELCQINKLIFYDLNKIRHILMEKGKISKLDSGFMDRCIGRLYRNNDKIRDIDREINEIWDSLDIWHLGYVFNL